MAVDIWDSALKLASDNLQAFVILMLVFLMIYFVVLELFDLAFGPLGALIGSIIDGFLLGWYISSLYEANSYLSSGKKVNYVNSVRDGITSFVSKQSLLVAVVGLVFIGGILYALAGGGAIGSVLAGIPTALAAATALTSLAPHQRGIFNYEILGEINESSPNSGLFVYGTILISIVPVAGLLQLVALPLAVSIISIRQTMQHQPARRHIEGSPGQQAASGRGNK